MSEVESTGWSPGSWRPEGKRQIVPRPEGIRVLCLGGVPGKVYEPPAWTEIGAPPPQPPPPE